ncbi:MAG: F420-0:Gamma-glutamyl ligase [Merismopedia sp. SIO2A8]|nr:F420-0:Gamma-glutamyl ligase [Merismopedia sp. SIO2A8]
MIGAGAVGMAAVILEWFHRRHPKRCLNLTPGVWEQKVQSPSHHKLIGHLELHNLTPSLEIMVPEVSADITLLSQSNVTRITSQIRIIPNHSDVASRNDDYWFAYIVKPGKTTGVTLIVDIQGDKLDSLQSVWVKVQYVAYGPQGRIPQTRHIIVPLNFPDPKQLPPAFSGEQLTVQPIQTHLLSHLDDPVELVERYVLTHSKTGDVVTIGETPLAIMQGQWRHPSDIHPGWLAKRLCYYFMPTSSLATACGLQTLVDLVGPWRVASAFVGGAIAKKFFGQPGMFYQWAGEQARLIDDVTGTLPPYDQFIVLGPRNPQQVVDRIRQETGLGAAIVDVNDLRAVKVLAKTSDVSLEFLEKALITNPAGNADEQTPIVLLHPHSN